MPQVTVNGTNIHYVDVGGGRETVVFSHSYLVDHTQFQMQIDYLKSRYRVLAYDHRDHGQSEKLTHAYDMEALYEDGVGFIEAMKCAPVHWVGLSTGGFVGMRIGFRRPELLRSLVLMDTSADRQSTFTRWKYRAMLWILRSIGFGPVTKEMMKSMFGPQFLQDPNRTEERMKWQNRIESNDPQALTRFGNAIFNRDDVVDQMKEVRCPAVVVAGQYDRAIAPSQLQQLASALPNAELIKIPDAGHLCSVEQPHRVNEVLGEFLTMPPDPADQVAG